MTKAREDSEDEMFMNNVKEAIDQQFFNDDLYNNEKTKIFQSKFEINKPCRKSLRTNSEPEDAFMDSGISATFQNFMAKKLDEILEGTIKLKNKKSIGHLDQEHEKKKNLGIKLLSTSKTFLTTEITEEHVEYKKKSKREKRKIIEDDNALIKFREAAINPEHILSKLDTKAWINRRPEPDFKYKRLRNGILIEQV